MFVGCVFIITGPRRREGKPRAKGYGVIGVKFQRPKFMRRRGTPSASEEHLASYVDSPKESSPEGLPEIAASFDPDEFDLSQLVKRFRARRAEERSRRMRSGAPSPESEMDEKLYESSAAKE